MRTSIRSRCASITPFIFLLILSACGGPNKGAPGHTFTVTIQDGVPTAINSSIPRYEAELFHYEEISGVREGDSEESLLSGPGLPILGEDGTFYLTDRGGSEARVVVFDASGDYVRQMGRRGEGPGEFRSPELQQVSDGIVLVLDRSSARLTRFRTDGRLLDVMPLPAVPSRLLWRQVLPAPDGQWILIGDERLVMTPGSEDLFARVSAVVYSSSWDSLASVDSNRILGPKRISVESGRNVMVGAGRRPFSPVPTIVYSPAVGLVVTDGGEPVVEIFGLDGSLYRRIRIDLPARRVTSADRERIEGPIREGMRDADEWSRAMAGRILETISYPENMAFWGESRSGWLRVDGGGFLWIRVNRDLEPDDLPEDLVRYMVVSPEGEFLGYTTLPPHRRGMAAVYHGRLVTMRPDEETGTIHIRSYRIIPAVPGVEYP